MLPYITDIVITHFSDSNSSWTSNETVDLFNLRAFISGLGLQNNSVSWKLQLWQKYQSINNYNEKHKYKYYKHLIITYDFTVQKQTQMAKVLHYVMTPWTDNNTDASAWHTHTHTHNRFTAGLEYVRVHPGQQVPER